MGSSLFGCAMIFCSFNHLASMIVAGIIAASLLLVLYWAKNWLARGVTLAFMLLIALGFWFKEGEYLSYLVLWTG